MGSWNINFFFNDHHIIFYFYCEPKTDWPLISVLRTTQRMYMQIGMFVGHILIHTIFAMQIFCRLTSKYVHMFQLLRTRGEKGNGKRLEFSSRSLDKSLCKTSAIHLRWELKHNFSDEMEWNGKQSKVVVYHCWCYDVCTHSDDNLLYTVTVLDTFLIANIYKMKRRTEQKKKNLICAKTLVLYTNCVNTRKRKTKKSEHSDKMVEKH